MKKTIFLFTGMMLATGWVAAQEQEQIQDARIVIEKNRTNEVQVEERSFEKIAPPRQNRNAPIELNYQPVEFQAELSALDPSIRVLGLKSPKLPKSSSNFFRAGFGNYITPLLEGYVNTVRNKNMDAGLYLRHYSSLQGPVDKKNSASSENILGGQFNYYGKGASLNTHIDYQRWGNRFYGYPAGTEVVLDDIKQNINFFNLGFDLKNTIEDANLDYKSSLNYHYTGDRFEASENWVEFDGDFLYNSGDVWQAGVMVELDFAARQDSLVSDNRLGLQIIPNVKMSFDQFDLRLGLNFAYQNDTTDHLDNFMVFPHFEGIYHMGEYFEVFASLKGDLHFNTYHNAIRYNPWMAANFALYNSATPYDFTVGGRGKFSHFLSYEAQVGIGQVSNLMTVVNNPLDQAGFYTLYDGGKTTLFHIEGHLTYEGNGINAGTDLRLNTYGTDQLEAAYHLPKLDLALWGNYQFNDKLSFGADLKVLGGITAANVETGATENLKTIIDLGAKADYKITEQFGAFVTIDNMLAQKYERFQHYPVRGFQMMVGATAQF
ncbi:hypothetical protein [Persicobacter diffluens]